MNIELRENQITWHLSDFEAGVAKRTWRFLGPVMEIQVKVALRIILQLSLLGKERMHSYIERIEHGEDTGSIVQEMVAELGITGEALAHGMPEISLKDIEDILE